MIAPISDDTRREIRAFAFAVAQACIPLFVAWAIDEAKQRLKRRREDEEKDE